MESVLVKSLMIEGAETLRRPAFWDAEGKVGRIVVLDPQNTPRLWTDLLVTALTEDGRTYEGKARAVAVFTYKEDERGEGLNQVTITWIGEPKRI